MTWYTIYGTAKYFGPRSMVKISQMSWRIWWSVDMGPAPAHLLQITSWGQSNGPCSAWSSRNASASWHQRWAASACQARRTPCPQDPVICKCISLFIVTEQDHLEVVFIDVGIQLLDHLWPGHLNSTNEKYKAGCELPHLLPLLGTNYVGKLRRDSQGLVDAFCLPGHLEL